MNILFITLLDFSSINENGIYTDLMREFIQDGHRVYIISPSEKRTKRPTEMKISDNCDLLKLRIGNIQKTSLFEKGITTLTIESIFIKGIRKYFANVKFDCIIYSTPPVTLQKVVEFVKKRDGAKSYLLLKDIFPQNAVDLGLLKTTGISGCLYKFFRKKEKELYSKSDYIGCMSKANVEYLLKNNPELTPKRVHVCPNSIDPVTIDHDKVKVREKYGIPINKTVFVYGGNLGKPQGIDFLLECLEKNVNSETAFFIIAGSGTEFKKIRAFLDCFNPTNILLFDQLPRIEYDVLISSCDVGMIFLDNRFTIPNFPSRILSYMQASMPVLAATDTRTDLKHVINEGGFGFWCESGNVKEFCVKMEKLCNPELRSRMGEKSRRYLEGHYTSKRSYEVIARHIT